MIRTPLSLVLLGPDRAEQPSNPGASHVTCIMENGNHPTSFRSCLGIIRLAKKLSPERLEAAAYARALITSKHTVIKVSNRSSKVNWIARIYLRPPIRKS